MQNTQSLTFRWILAVAAISGIMGLFLPFSWGVSPMKALFTDLWRLSAPALLSIFITLATIRWIVSGSFSKAEQAIAYLLGLVTACSLLFMIFSVNLWPTDFQEWLTLLIPLLVLISGAYSMVRKFRLQGSREIHPVMAMQVVYVAHALFCLIGFWEGGKSSFGGGWQIGAYLILLTTILYLIQMAFFLAPGNKRSAPTLETTAY